MGRFAVKRFPLIQTLEIKYLIILIAVRSLQCLFMSSGGLLSFTTTVVVLDLFLVALLHVELLFTERLQQTLSAGVHA